MAYTPLFSEILEKIGKLKTKKQKIDFLRQNNTPALRMVVKSSFDPNIVWILPEGSVPFKPNGAPEGTEHTVLASEARKLYNFVEGGNGALTKNKREMMFVQMLEGLHKDEADIIVAAKDKSLHKVYKGLSAAVVKEAFNWDDNFMIKDDASQKYEQYAQRANV
tara:strand:+ start:5506 stop:5997 length:492 start_codon:yes stop_codon:yes gene_type:complete